jgi:hypothetical protein
MPTVNKLLTGMNNNMFIMYLKFFSLLFLGIKFLNFVN